jgi:tripartite-type tricarboxylate transporter receptor subunit TctC
MTTPRVIASLIAAMFLAPGDPSPAAAQSYPNRPIKLVVSSPAGTSPDVVARLVAEPMASKLGYGVIVDNRPGGGHLIAVKSVAAAEPDGYTLLLGAPGSLTINPSVRGNSDTEPSKSLLPIALFATIPILLAVSPAVPARTLKELVAYSKANPDRLSYGAAPATPPHLLGEYVRVKTGADIVFVPYRGTVQSLPDLFGGRIQIICESPGVLLPHIKQGNLTPLVVTSAARLPDLPDLPTLAELGIGGFPPQTWMGMVAPPGTPDAVVSKLNGVANEVLKSVELKASLAKLGFTAQTGSPQDFAALIATDLKQWSAVVKATNVMPPNGN